MAQPRWRRTRFGENQDLMLRDKWLGQVGPEIKGECRYMTRSGESGTATSQSDAKARVEAVETHRSDRAEPEHDT